MNPRRWLVPLAVATVLLVGCEQTQPESADEPAQVVPVKGSDVPKVVLTAAGRLRRPDPICITPTLAASSLAVISEVVLTRALLICRGVSAGLACFTTAAAPAIIGAEKLVP